MVEMRVLPFCVLESVMIGVAAKKLRPERVDGIEESLWELMQAMWQDDPTRRPRFIEVLERLQELEKIPSSSSREDTLVKPTRI